MESRSGWIVGMLMLVISAIYALLGGAAPSDDPYVGRWQALHGASPARFEVLISEFVAGDGKRYLQTRFDGGGASAATVADRWERIDGGALVPVPSGCPPFKVTMQPDGTLAGMHPGSPARGCKEYVLFTLERAR